MNAYISKTAQARLMKFADNIFEYCTQLKMNLYQSIMNEKELSTALTCERIKLNLSVFWYELFYLQNYTS